MGKSPKSQDTSSGVIAGLIMLGGFAWAFHSCTMPTPITDTVLAQNKDAQMVQSNAVRSPGEEWATGLDYESMAGAWHIGGKVLGKGNTTTCRMQREGSMGTQFAYMDGMSAGIDGTATWALFVVGTKLANGQNPTITAAFDGAKQKPIVGRVDGGYASIDLDKQDISVLTKFVNLFQGSKTLRLTVSLPGYLDEVTYVELADSATAFDYTGICLKSMMDLGMERMKTYAR